MNLTDLNEKRYYDAVNAVVRERINLGGKAQFLDLYGKPGACVATMGANMKDQPCGRCGLSIVKISFGGRQVYLCPNCQK